MVWKVYMAVEDCRLKRSVILHSALHDFKEGRGTGTATLEAKLVHKLGGIAHKPLFQVFLDVRRSTIPWMVVVAWIF